MRRITLLTDFGTADGYVAAMKGVIASIAPEAIIDDASHDIPPGDVVAASHALERYWDLYPPGTVHVVVVDPGVGSARRAIAVEAEGRYFVAPDNGVLSPVFDAAGTSIHALEDAAFRRPEVSSTFHGRDVFAPAAAHLARGAPIARLGRPIGDPVRLEAPAAVRDEAGVHGRVVHVDRFGNLITNIPGEWVEHAAEVLVAGRSVGPIRRIYADVSPGELLALVGSAGVVEIAVRDGSAAERLGVRRGTDVRVR